MQLSSALPRLGRIHEKVFIINANETEAVFQFRALTFTVKLLLKLCLDNDNTLLNAQRILCRNENKDKQDAAASC